MKNELVTAIGAAIMGVLIAFFVTNLFIGDIECIDHVTEEDIIDLETNTPTENTTQENNNGSTN